MLHKLKKVTYIIRSEGVLGFLIKALQKINKKAQKGSMTRKRPVHSLVKTEDILKADFSSLRWGNGRDGRVVKKNSYKTGWIMSTPGETSGGHQNIFRFLSYLESRGHEVKIYLYDNIDTPTDILELKKMLKRSVSYPDIKADIQHYRSGVDSDTDAIFATGWETAYPSLNDKSNAKRFYFVQDFEPYFNPVGTENVLAENTYKFGFQGITAGGWLAHKLKAEYGMSTDFFDFGADKTIYKYENSGERKGVFFYARPVTARRGFELGVHTLSLFAKERPDYDIILAGWDVSDYDIPFRYQNLSNLSIDKLNSVYNQCAVGLVMSLTNMSLLPLELLSSGVIPVVNDGPNNRMVSDNKYIEYSTPTPKALAEKMISVVDKKSLAKYSKRASESVSGGSWNKSGDKFVKIFEERMHG